MAFLASSMTPATRSQPSSPKIQAHTEASLPSFDITCIITPNQPVTQPVSQYTHTHTHPHTHTHTHTHTHAPRTVVMCGSPTPKESSGPVGGREVAGCPSTRTPSQPRLARQVGWAKRHACNAATVAGLYHTPHRARTTPVSTAVRTRHSASHTYTVGTSCSWKGPTAGPTRGWRRVAHA